MGRRATPSSSLLAQVRAYYGLRQHELALLLGVAESQVGHLETGRRALSLAVLDRLAPFTQQMAEEAEPLPAAPPPGPLEAGPLEARRAARLHEAA
ncbi:helix-turn-helix transcriptional regulator, partial [Hymenobacter daeguensis]